MKLVVVISLLISCCVVVSVAQPSAVLFEPIFFSINDHVDPKSSLLIKERTRTIPLIKPRRNQPASSGKRYQAIGFPTNELAGHTEFDNVDIGESNRLLMPSSTVSPSGFVIGFTTESYQKFDDDDCHVKDALVMYKGKCSLFLSEYSCRPIKNHWLVWDNRKFEPKCVPKPCSSGMLPYEGKCVNLANQTVCGKHAILYVEYTGEVYCDCEPSYFYDDKSQICVGEHAQGSCPDRQYIEYSPRNGLTCVHNPCETDEFLLNLDNGSCYKKMYHGLCDIKGSNADELKFNDRENTVECVSADVRNVFEVPALTSCPPGYRRDYLRRCQVVLRFGAISPLSYRVNTVSTSMNSRYSRCPSGYSKYPDGTCKKVNRILG